MNKVVAVLFGGQNSEHPVSLMSASSVLKNLSSQYDSYMVGITKDGRWYHFSGDIAEIENDTWENNEKNEEVILSPNHNHHGFYQLKQNNFQYVDVVLPILHGRNGEDGTIQGLCQLSGIPCVSCNLTSCAIAMDKEYTHIICENAGIKMAKYICVHKDEYQMNDLLALAKEKLGFPCYVKPTNEGSSFGAHKINNENEFAGYVTDAFTYDHKILLEEFIEGTEVSCAVLGKEETGYVAEIVVETEMYGYAEKYDGYKTNIYCPSKNLTSEQCEQVNNLGLKVAKILGCDCLARVDFFNSKKGFILIEANLIPGFTSHSLYPTCFKAKGKTYTELLDQLINIALEKK